MEKIIERLEAKRKEAAIMGDLSEAYAYETAIAIVKEELAEAEADYWIAIEDRDRQEAHD